MSFTRPETAALLVGGVLRFVLAPVTSWTADVYIFYDTVMSILAGQGVYGGGVYSYPPLWGIILGFPFQLLSLLIDPSTFAMLDPALWSASNTTNMIAVVVTSPVFNLVLKTPLILADITCGLLIRRVVTDYSDSSAGRKGFVFWMFNPILIVTSAMQGQFDILPGLAVLIAALALSQRYYFVAGCWIAVGCFLKMFPIFLLPLYIFIIIGLESSKPDPAFSLTHRLRITVESTFKPFLRFIFGVLFVGFLFFLPMIEFLGILSMRLETLSGGGMTFWSVKFNPALAWIAGAVWTRPQAVLLVITSIEIVLLLLIGVTAARRVKNDPLKSILIYQTMSIAIIYLASATVTPQHICWVAPSAICVGFMTGRFRIRFFILSVLAVIYLFSLQSVFALFFPLGTYTSFVESEQIAAAVLSYWQMPGVFSNWLRYDLLFFSGFAGFLTIVSLFIPEKFIRRVEFFFKRVLLSQPCDAIRRHPIDSTTMNPIKLSQQMFSRSSSSFVVFVLVCLLVSSPSFMQTGTASFELDSVIPSAGEETSFAMRYTVRAGILPFEVGIAALAANRSHTGQRILIYWDSAYPTAMTRANGVVGLPYHIERQMTIAGENYNISSVNAEGLKDIFLQLEEDIVVVATGVFPETVFSNTTNLVGPWLRNGGTLFWAGGSFAYFSGRANQDLSQGGWIPGLDGQERILDFRLTTGSRSANTHAIQDSNLSRGLSLSYDLIGVGTPTNRVISNDGLVLGRIGLTDDNETRTSIAAVPVGSGHLVLFGQGISNEFSVSAEDIISRDIARILLSRVLYSSGSIASCSVRLNRNEVITDRIDIELPDSWEPLIIVLVAFSRSPHSYLSEVFVVEIDS